MRLILPSSEASVVLEAAIRGSVAVAGELGHLDLPLAGGRGAVSGELELGGVGGHCADINKD